MTISLLLLCAVCISLVGDLSLVVFSQRCFGFRKITCLGAMNMQVVFLSVIHVKNIASFLVTKCFEKLNKIINKPLGESHQLILVDVSDLACQSS